MLARPLFSIFLATLWIGAVNYTPAAALDPCQTRSMGWYWYQTRDKFPVSNLRFQDLTHVIYNPEREVLVTPDGHIKQTRAIDADLAELVAAAHAHGVKVQMMFGEHQVDFLEMMSKPATRAVFIGQAIRYVQDHHLDGVEFDWEGIDREGYDWMGPEGQEDRRHYTDLVIETKKALPAHHNLVSISGAAWLPCFVTPEAYPYLDYISVMSYRDINHAINGLKVWTDAGAPPELLNMGMAVGFKEHGWDQKQAADEVRYVMENGFGGLFLFQLSYDKTGDGLMLKAVGDAMRQIKKERGCQGPSEQNWDRWQNALKPKGAPAKELTLTRNGITRYSIVLGAGPPAPDQKAAEQLQHWLGEMTGAKLEIVTEGQRLTDESRLISIGRTQALAGANLATAKEDLEDDGYGIGVKDQKLFLWGGRVRGVINAVMALLEEDLGCRWYTDVHSRIPHNKSLTFSPVPRTYKPAVKLRDPFWTVAFDAEWSLANRTNAPRAKVPEAWGGRLDYDGMFVHTFHRLVPPGKYFQDHPEYFMLGVAGQRSSHQLCSTHPEVVAMVIKRVRETLKENPHSEIISVSKTDGQGYWCHCETCKALDEPEGTSMAALLHLVNDVAADIEEDYPHVMISTLAYGETLGVPKTMRPRHNVGIRLCSDGVGAWTRPFDPAGICDVAELAKAWSAVHDRIYIWDYVINFSHYLAPMPNMDIIAESIRFWVQNNAEGIMTQGNYENIGAEREWMRAWVTAKLLWDPALDVRQLMLDFVWGHYGKAAPAVVAYYQLLRDQGKNYAPELSGPGLAKLGYDGIRYGMDHPFLTREFIERADQLFDRAVKLADDDKVLLRVQWERLPIMYVKLMRGPEFVGDGYPDLLKRFEAIARKIGITHLREGPADLDEKLQNWKNAWKEYHDKSAASL